MSWSTLHTSNEVPSEAVFEDEVGRGRGCGVATGRESTGGGEGRIVDVGGGVATERKITEGGEEGDRGEVGEGGARLVEAGTNERAEALRMWCNGGCSHP